MFSIASDVRNMLGDCPLWCERTRSFYWTDIEASELLTLKIGEKIPGLTGQFFPTLLMIAFQKGGLGASSTTTVFTY